MTSPQIRIAAATTPQQVPCQDFVELVTEWWDGALDAHAERLMAAHLEWCEGCANHVAQLNVTLAALRDLGSQPWEAALSAARRREVLAAFRESRGGPD